MTQVWETVLQKPFLLKFFFSKPWWLSLACSLNTINDSKVGKLALVLGGEMGTREEMVEPLSLKEKKKKKTTNPSVSQTHSPAWIASKTKASLPRPCLGSLPCFLPRKDTQWKGQVMWLILDPTAFQNLDLTFVKHDPTNPSSLFLFIFEPCRKQRRQPQFALKC